MNTIRFATCILTLFTLSACGGGGGGGSDDSDPASTPTPNPTPTSGIGRTGVAVGPVTTFGSIVVNGVRYDTTSTDFSIDGEAGTQDDLRVGDIVIVSGTVNDDGLTGTADRVFYDDIVTGPVAAVDPATNSLTVLGQVVLIRPETLFDQNFTPASIDGIAIDQIVEISGIVDADGNIVASRIELEDSPEQFEIHGIVASLDTVSSSFSLGALTVDYSTATLEDFDDGQISEGDLVEAKGDSFGPGGEFIATLLEREDDFPETGEGDYVELEGFITRFASAEDFDVAGITVSTTSATEYEDGSASDLGLNVKVEVEGEVNASGILVAEEIEIERDNDVRITGSLDSVDSSADSVVILGITVGVDASTRIEDDSDADIDPLTLADVNAGDYVEVRGVESPAGSGDIVAALFEREDPDDETILRGQVTTVSEPTLEILGVSIETSASTQFRNSADLPISSAEFFAAVSAGQTVEAKGTESGDTTIIAEEVELED